MRARVIITYAILGVPYYNYSSCDGLPNPVLIMKAPIVKQTRSHQRLLPGGFALNAGPALVMEPGTEASACSLWRCEESNACYERHHCKKRQAANPKPCTRKLKPLTIGKNEGHEPARPNPKRYSTDSPRDLKAGVLVAHPRCFPGLRLGA